MTQETVLETRKSSERLSWREIGILGVHAFIGWALCTATMGISMALTTV